MLFPLKRNLRQLVPHTGTIPLGKLVTGTSSRGSGCAHRAGNFWRNRGDGGFDTHSNNFNMCKGYLFPKLDGCLSAQLIDLEQRGLLEDTLVVAAGEFGRTPKINRDGGRDYWAGVNSMLLAGSGIKRGYVFGSSDRVGAFPSSKPVGPWDVQVTILHCFGINPASQVKDPLGRPIPISTGKVITDVLL